MQSCDLNCTYVKGVDIPAYCTKNYKKQSFMQYGNE